MRHTPLVLLPVLLTAGLLAPVTATAQGAAALAPVAEAPQASAVLVRPQQPLPVSLTAGDLGRRVNAALGASGASVIGAAVDVAGLGAVVRRNQGQALPPASTQKAFVGLASLLRRGPAAVSVTTVARTGTPTASGTLPGSLHLVAGGDPTLTRGGLYRLAQQVRASGIRVVRGHLLLDDSRYDRRVSAYGWKPEWLGNEVGPLSALAVDANAYRDDAAFLSDPAIHNARLLRTYLQRVGVSVLGTVARATRPAGAPTLAAVSSPALAAVVRSTMENSRNFVAEMLLKELGRSVRGSGTTLDGLAALPAVLPGVLVGPGGDGSGLSRLNRQSPNGLLQLLRLATASPVGTHFFNALPLACREGTLEKRMCDTVAEGRAAAKTGTLTETRALSGYTRTASGRLVSFTFQLQGIGSGLQARSALDRAVVVLSSAAG